MDKGTGLIYMQQRYYDPQVGGFLSVDPAAVNTRNAANFCRYCYASDNPYRFTDPDGRQSADFVMPSGLPLDPNNLPKDPPPPKVAAPPDLPKGLSATTLATGDTKPTFKGSVAAGVGVKVEKKSDSPAKVSIVTPAVGGEASVTWNLATITYDASDTPTDSPVDVSLGMDVGVVGVLGISVGWAPPAKFELKVDGGFGVAGKAHYDGATYDVGLTPEKVP